MKRIDLEILSELMKNSKMRGVELAETLGSSSPAISRRMKRLENNGYIREYTLIPHFIKLGYELMVVTLVKLKPKLTPEQVEEAHELLLRFARETPEKDSYSVIMAERGMGLARNVIFITCHRNFSTFVEFRRRLIQFKFLETTIDDNFLIDLHDKIRYLPLTFSNFANQIAKLATKNGAK